MRQVHVLSLLLALMLPGGIVLDGDNVLGGGGGALCPGSFLFCQDFEGDSAASDCDNESPDATTNTGNMRDCDCTTSSGCTDATRPATVPQGTQVLDLRNASSDNTDDLVNWLDQVDNADAHDIQYVRACFRLPAANGGDTTFRDNFVFYNDSGLWDSGSDFGRMLTAYDATPQIMVECPHSSYLAAASSAISVSSPTNWHEITMKVQESTGQIQLCLDQAIGHASCVSCDGDYHSGKVDGFEIYFRGLSIDMDGSREQWDAIRWSSSDPGATEGCSGL